MFLTNVFDKKCLTEKLDLLDETFNFADARLLRKAQMKCQVDYAENYRTFTIPNYIKQQSLKYYPAPGCYFDSSKSYF
jgi:hypothetical protein